MEGVETGKIEMFTLDLIVFPGCGCRHFVVRKPKTDVSEVLIGQLVCGSQSERSVHPASAFRLNFRFCSDEEFNKFCGFLVDLEQFYAIYCTNTTWITIYYLSWLFLCETNVWQGPGQRKIEFYYYRKCKFEIEVAKQATVAWPPDLGFGAEYTSHIKLKSQAMVCNTPQAPE